MSHRAATLVLVWETMLVLQKVERFLAIVLMNMATPAEPDGKLEKALLRDKQTMGQLMKHFADRTELPEHFALTFESLLQDRNVFVHNLFMQPWFDLNSEDGCLRLEGFMRNLRGSAKVAMNVMMASLIPKDTDAPRSEDAQQYVNNVLTRINQTLHPDVKALAASDYAERTSTNARANFSVKRREA